MEESNDKKGEEEKLEDKKKINEIKDESEDTKKNESKDNDNSGKIPFEVTKEQEKFLLETLKNVHDDIIRNIVLYQNKAIITSGEDNKVKVWDFN